MLTAVTTAPEFVMPCGCPVEPVALERWPRITLLFMFSVPHAPLFDNPLMMAFVAVVAVTELLITELPFMFIVPGTERFVMHEIPFVVEVEPPRTQFCTVLLLMLIVAVASRGA